MPRNRFPAMRYDRQNRQEKKNGGSPERRPTVEVQERLVVSDADRLRGADVHTSAAIATGLGIDVGDRLLHGNRVQRTGGDTLSTCGAFFRVNNCCHESKLHGRNQRPAADRRTAHRPHEPSGQPLEHNRSPPAWEGRFVRSAESCGKRRGNTGFCHGEFAIFAIKKVTGRLGDPARQDYNYPGRGRRLTPAATPAVARRK